VSLTFWATGTSAATLVVLIWSSTHTDLPAAALCTSILALLMAMLLLRSRMAADQTQSIEALRCKEQQLARVLEGSDQGYWDWDLRTNAFQVSPRFESMLGYEPGEMDVAPSRWDQLVHPDDFPKALESIELHTAGRTAYLEVEIRCKAKDGSWRWILTRGRVVEFDGNGLPVTMSGTNTDITSRKQLEAAQCSAAVVFENCCEGVLVADARGNISRVNPAFTRITGYAEHEVLGRSPRVLSSGRHDEAFYREFWSALNGGGVWRGEIWNRTKTGELYVAHQSVCVVKDEQGQPQHFVSVFSDVTQLKTHEEELDRLAHFDALTGLPNRSLLADRLQQAIHRANRNGRSCAVCVVDLDDFKQINEQHGRAAGDQFIVGVAENLKRVLRVDDTLARLGGDEFVVLLPDVANPKEGTQVLDRVLAAIARPVHIANVDIESSGSIGVSLYPADDVDPDTLLRHADHAMQQAKQSGKARYQLFDPEIDRTARHRLEQLIHLEQALRESQFVLFYQPKVDLVSGQMVGAEALIRWSHPERGLIPPGEFLSHLQGSRLEFEVGDWVIDSALLQMSHWKTQGLAIPVSVNVSANQLMDAGFTERLRRALERHEGVDPRHLELEVLETVAISDLGRASEVLRGCIELGVGFSLDDFGTGYSSLTYLRKLPVHTLKIDQSFVRHMLNDRDDLSIVQGVIHLADAFHRRVVAEGVETLDHGAVLLSLGCRLAQGYGIAKPMPASALPGWHDQWREDQMWMALSNEQNRQQRILM
jgi:diguanylate cyclase (GGDEF)-like protein/PAS domain S-box-containing protein